MYTLYHFPHSQHARRVVSLMELAGIPYQLQHVAMDEGEHAAPAFLARNPNHQVPVLEQGDFRLWESNAILRYLCEQHNLDAWYPRPARQRARVDQWLDWNQCRLAPTVVDIVLHSVFLGDQGDPQVIARGRQALPERLAILEQALADSAFLAGDTPTIADLSVASNITQLGYADIAVSGHTAQWYQRMLALETAAT
ncbi:MAG: glutathione S-transferase family protein [Pseudomonadota bacterium]|nr:glutathione S-transferase family protein [Pseudomonadota bacterium]